MLADPEYLFNAFGVNKEIDVSLTAKSPYNYYDLITNIDELKSISREVEQQQITQEQLALFKQEIETELKDIRINFNGNRP